MFRKILLLFSGNAAASLLSLARNLLIARMLSVEDYGIAATFALVMTLIEMATALGLQTQIVQSRDGDNPDFQAALQGFQALRGLVSAAILFLGAGAAASFLKLPDLVWAYRMVALVPLFSGLMHFDIYRLNRSMRFGPLLLTNTAPVLLTLALVWPLAWWLGDWRVMLGIILTQTATMTVMSHLVAERRYRVTLDPTRMRQSMSFGWPLLINNALLFLVFQGDRALVARELGPQTLAIFSMGVTLTLTPTLVMTKSLQNLLLPPLSTQKDPVQFNRLATVTLQAAVLNALILLLGVYFLGAPMIQVVLGEKYLSLIPILGALASVQALRVLKTGGNTVALSQGQTGNAMVSNLFRVSTLPFVWLALVRGAGLEVVIALAALGETLGYVASLTLVRWRLGQRLLPLTAPLLCTVTVMALVAGLHPIWPNMITTLLVVGMALVAFATTSELRHWALRRLRRT
jgi:O-antigen/teichoic acid export membrane protein